jgi:hypothetical protein
MLSIIFSFKECSLRLILARTEVARASVCQKTTRSSQACDRPAK